MTDTSEKDTAHEGQVPLRRPKGRTYRAYADMRPGSNEAIRCGCRCSTISRLPSPHCPHHWRQALAGQQRDGGG